MAKVPRIFVVVPTTQRFFTGIMLGVMDWIRQHGWRGGYWDTAGPDQVPSPLVLKKFDGVVAALSNRDLLEAMRDLPQPVVNVSSCLREVPVPSVLPDNRRVGEMVAEHFLDRGFEHFVYLGWDTLAYSADRGEGFARRLRQDGHDCLRMAPQHIWRDQPETLGEWARNLPTPLAVMCADDDVAALFSNNAFDAGLHIPRDLAVVGVNNCDFHCELGPVPLSSVDMRTRTIGQRAAGLLADLLAGKPPRDEKIEPAGVVVRNSSDVVAASDPVVRAAAAYIAHEYRRPLDVEEISRHVCLARRTLERRFHAALGRSPLSQIHHVRVERARQMMHDTNLKLGAIATACGFSDMREMVRCFRKIHGLVPSAYRQRMRQEG